MVSGEEEMETGKLKAHVSGLVEPVPDEEALVAARYVGNFEFVRAVFSECVVSTLCSAGERVASTHCDNGQPPTQLAITTIVSIRS